MRLTMSTQNLVRERTHMCSQMNLDRLTLTELCLELAVVSSGIQTASLETVIDLSQLKQIARLK